MAVVLITAVKEEVGGGGKRGRVCIERSQVGLNKNSSLFMSSVKVNGELS